MKVTLYPQIWIWMLPWNPLWNILTFRKLQDGPSCFKYENLFSDCNFFHCSQHWDKRERLIERITGGSFETLSLIHEKGMVKQQTSLLFFPNQDLPPEDC